MRPFQRRFELNCFFIVACCAVCVQAQQPGKPKDPTPFERPKSICIFTTSDVHTAFQKIVAIVTNQGFKSDGVDWSSGQLSAWRSDGESSPNQDKILLWLERDFELPQSKLRLYLLYGRYEQFFGVSGDLTRVKVDADFENHQIGALRQKLMDFAATGGGQ